MNLFKKIYKLEKKQKLNLSLEEAWDFFSSPKNLAKITPDYMHFKITSDLGDGKMYAGQVITYIVKPLLGIPIKWMTEITHVKDKIHFIDEQRFGPYSLWHHQHWFEDKGDHVIMRDIIHYALPLGIIGRLGKQLFIGKQLEDIFDYRYKVVDKLFNN